MSSLNSPCAASSCGGSALRAALLHELNPAQREDAVNSLAYEAEARLHDPVYGCVAHIQILQQWLKQIQHDLFSAKKELSTYIGPATLGPLLLPHHYPFGMAEVSIHQQQYGMNMGLGLTSGTNQQILFREQQQQQIEVQQLAAVAVAAREQEMLRNIEAQQRQQNEVNARFGNNSGFVDGKVFNNNTMQVQMAAAAAGGASLPSGLASVSSQQFDNSSFHIQQQQKQQQRVQIHHHYAEHHHQIQQQLNQRAGSDEGRSGSIGPTS